MFTGLIERLGTIVSVEETRRDDGISRRFEIDCGDADADVDASDSSKYLEDAVVGESIAVNGVCLTATRIEGGRFWVEAVEETMRRTTLGQKKAGDRVNLERALKANARLGGHIVQGHIDGVGHVVGTHDEGAGIWVTFEPPFEMMKSVVEKGSVCIDGVSLTVANVSYSKFSVALIPHTREVTNAGEWVAGAAVNLESDILAKYVERLMHWNTRLD